MGGRFVVGIVLWVDGSGERQNRETDAPTKSVTGRRLMEN
jgi:hypothetical protein